MTDIPPSLLIRFFQDAASAMSEYEHPATSLSAVPPTTRSLSDHRRALLQVQRTCLDRVVVDYPNISVAQVESALKKKHLGNVFEKKDDVQEAMSAMNDSARLAFCRLVLHDECRWEKAASATSQPHRTLNNGDNAMSRADLVEYAGLLNGVVRLPNVQGHLAKRTKLFPDLQDHDDGDSRTPKNRLERIQELLLHAIGFHNDFGKRELARYYQEQCLSEEDAELAQLLTQLSSNMTVALTNASMATHATTTAAAPYLSDQDSGGVTRVVSVRYSEKLVMPDGQEVLSSNAAPTTESIRPHDNHNNHQLEQLQMARQAASLEQQILHELEEMSQVDRNAKLLEAQQANDEFVRQAMQIPTGRERITFLTSVDPRTQHLLLIHKLWTKKEEEGV